MKIMQVQSNFANIKITKFRNKQIVDPRHTTLHSHLSFGMGRVTYVNDLGYLEPPRKYICVCGPRNVCSTEYFGLKYIRKALGR